MADITTRIEAGTVQVNQGLSGRITLTVDAVPHDIVGQVPIGLTPDYKAATDPKHARYKIGDRVRVEFFGKADPVTGQMREYVGEIVNVDRLGYTLRLLNWLPDGRPSDAWGSFDLATGEFNSAAPGDSSWRILGKVDQPTEPPADRAKIPGATFRYIRRPLLIEISKILEPAEPPADDERNVMAKVRDARRLLEIAASRSDMGADLMKISTLHNLGHRILAKRDGVKAPEPAEPPADELGPLYGWYFYAPDISSPTIDTEHGRQWLILGSNGDEPPQSFGFVEWSSATKKWRWEITCPPGRASRISGGFGLMPSFNEAVMEILNPLADLGAKLRGRLCDACSLERTAARALEESGQG